MLQGCLKNLKEDIQEKATNCECDRKLIERPEYPRICPALRRTQLTTFVIAEGQSDIFLDVVPEEPLNVPDYIVVPIVVYPITEVEQTQA